MATQFKIKGLKKWQYAIDARGFDKTSRIYMRRATKLNGLVAERLQRKTIQSGQNLKKNAALTVLIKGANKPLVDSPGGLFQSITSEVIDDFTAFAGVLRTNDSFNVGIALHEGYQMNVTRDMRSLFIVLWKASTGQLDPSKLKGRAKELFERLSHSWLPLKKDTSVIVVPPRRWIKIAFSNTQMVKQCRDNWKQALERSFSDRGKGR